MSDNKEGNSVTKKQESLPANILEQDASAGLQGLTNDDLATPRLKILMNGSEELEVNEKLKPGQIYNTVTGEAFDGKEGIIVVPCAYQRQYIEWEERGTGSGAPVNIYDVNSDILQKTTRNSKNKDELENGNYIETTVNHFVMLKDSKYKTITPALITMKSTQLKKSRRWNSMMKTLRVEGSNGPFNPAMFSHEYKLTVTKEKNDQGTWYGWNVERVGPVSDLNIYKDAKEFAQSVKSGIVQAKPEMEEASTNSGTKTPF